MQSEFRLRARIAISYFSTVVHATFGRLNVIPFAIVACMGGSRLRRALESNGRHFERATERQLLSFAAPAENRRHCMSRAEP